MMSYNGLMPILTHHFYINSSDSLKLILAHQAPLSAILSVIMSAAKHFCQPRAYICVTFGAFFCLVHHLPITLSSSTTMFDPRN